MRMPDPKKIAVAILARKPAKGDAPDEPDTGDDGASDDDKAPLRSAAQDVLDAVKAGDADGLADALKAAFDLMGSAPDEDAP